MSPPDPPGVARYEVLTAHGETDHAIVILVKLG